MPFKSSEKEPERFAQKNRDKKTKDGKEQVSQYFSRQRKCGPHKGKYCIDGKSSLMSTNVSDHVCLTTKCLQLIISSLHGVQFNDETPLSFHGWSFSAKTNSA